MLTACTACGLPVSVEKISLHGRTLAELEQRKETVDAKLKELSSSTLRSGVGNLGWISKMTPKGPQIEWAQINLDHIARIDQVVLVPVIWRDSEGEHQADGFPRTFKLIAGTGAQSNGNVVAEFNRQDPLQPRTAPLVIPISPTDAAWVRIEAQTEPSLTLNGKHGVQLAEMLVFSGDENVALNRPVRVSSAQNDWVDKAMYQAALTDGLMPYLMDAAAGAEGEPYIAFYQEGVVGDPYIAFYQDDIGYALSIDLGEPRPVNEVHLHAADIRENIPRIYHADYAMPLELRIEGAFQPDFSDAFLLTEYSRTTIYETGPIVMLRFPETRCRYVRFNTVKGYGAPEANQKRMWRCVGFAEIEILAKGRNVARGITMQDSGTAPGAQGHMENLTDGRNHYGNILPIKTWLNELALRHDLETERPLLTAELNTRYARQKKNLLIMYWAAAILIAAIVLIILIERLLHARHIARVRQRFAANLHDELGANLHTIGLLGDTALAMKNDPDKLDNLLQRIRALTERSGTAARHCANLIEAEGLFDDLPGEMHQISSRIMTDLNHTISIEGESMLQPLGSRKRIDLLLFYKECLVNVIRHSGATQVSTRLIANRENITLTITDNGCGLNGTVPASLKRRARLLRARVSAPPTTGGGTQIVLKLRNHAGLFRPPFSKLVNQSTKQKRETHDE
jgi:signal transduction histidine kinase